MKQEQLGAALDKIFAGIDEMRVAYPSRKFTIDGRLVGDIGEMLADRDYDITVDHVSKEKHDGRCNHSKRLVQIKATFKDQLSYKTVPDLYLGLKLFPDGSYQEIFNGPGHLIAAHYSHRKGIGHKLLSFPNSSLATLSQTVAPTDRVQLRESKNI